MESWKVGRVVCLAILLSNVPTFRPSHLQWLPAERVLVSDYSFVTGLAVTPFAVYAATTHGLIAYDRTAARWRLPVSVLDGYPGRVQVALADPAGDAVWLGTADGWARYDAQLRDWERGIVAGGVRDLMLDARDPAAGIYLRTPFDWRYLPRGGLIAAPGRPLPPPEARLTVLGVEPALALAPQADALRALLLTDERLRTYRFTTAARSPDGAELFLGTTGMGVIRLDPAMGSWDALEYGLGAARAGAVARGSDGVWVAGTEGVGGRSGVTWVAADLSRMRRSEGARGAAGGLAFLEARALLAGTDGLWLATDRGLFRLDDGGMVRSRIALDAHALAPAPDGVWVGHRAGLAVVAAGGGVEPVVDGVPVLALVAAGDTVWVGTTAGLAVLLPGSAALRTVFAGGVRALTRAGDTIVAATADQLAWRDPAGGAWTRVRPTLPLGAIHAMAWDGEGVWIAGATGLAFWRIGAGTFTALQAPRDVPAPVRDVAVDGEWIWAATDSGLVRFARRAALSRGSGAGG